LIPTGELVTVPEPVPAFATVKVKVEVPAELKVAVTDRVWVIDKTHGPAPVHAPDHPENVEPIPALAVKVTDVPDV
jgi:hypothetical protein